MIDPDPHSLAHLAPKCVLSLLQRQHSLSLGEDIPMSAQCVVERLVVVIHDGYQFVLQLPQQSPATDTASIFLNPFVQSAAVTG